jgi:hypothetical protein
MNCNVTIKSLSAKMDYKKGGLKMMRQNRLQLWQRIGIQFLVATVMLSLLLLPATAATSDKEASDKNKSTLGSGTQYTTTVYRQTEGELSAEDFRQVSTLASQIMQHLNAAVAYLDGYDQENAKAELNQTQRLIDIIRDILPTTIVTTITKDSKGKEVYKNENRIQDDLVPIYEMMTSVDVVSPIIDAKKEEASLKGLRLADAEILQTSVLLDLSYVSRKINKALKILAKEPGKAEDELNLAQIVGVRFSVDKQDSSLVKAQRALRLAERMVNERKFEGAEENLRLAKIHLEAYRSLVGRQRKDEVEKMQKDIDQLFGKLEEDESESTVRRLWNRATGWFTQKTGQTHQTTAPDEAK